LALIAGDQLESSPERAKFRAPNLVKHYLAPTISARLLAIGSVPVQNLWFEQALSGVESRCPKKNCESE
jgi:hypothetical protein